MADTEHGDGNKPVSHTQGQIDKILDILRNNPNYKYQPSFKEQNKFMQNYEEPIVSNKNEQSAVLSYDHLSGTTTNFIRACNIVQSATTQGCTLATGVAGMYLALSSDAYKTNMLGSCAVLLAAFAVNLAVMKHSTPLITGKPAPRA